MGPYMGVKKNLGISVLIFKKMLGSRCPWLRTIVYNVAYLGCVSECRSIAAPGLLLTSRVSQYQTKINLIFQCRF